MLQRHQKNKNHILTFSCLLYTSDAADERSSVDLGGRRIIKKNKKTKNKTKKTKQKRKKNKKDRNLKIIKAIT